MPTYTEVKGLQTSPSALVCALGRPRTTSADPEVYDKKHDKDDVLQADNYRKATSIGRAVVIAVAALCLWYKDAIQVQVDELWDKLRQDEFFQCAHYETIYVTVVYTLLIIVYPYAMHHIPFFRRFRVSKDVRYVNQTIRGMGVDLIFHLTPLLIADAIIIKRYPGVPHSEIAVRQQDWIVRTRPLPRDPPGFLTLCVGVAGSVFLFDAFFTAVHYALHRNLILYKYFHAQHHDHQIVHAHVTNQLSVVERGLQVISANYALKAFMCHPLTRLVFVPVFLWLLIENHTGIDLPWAPHRLLPLGVMGGPAKHHAHHTNGHGHYQPFFNYLDNWLEKQKTRKMARQKSS